MSLYLDWLRELQLAHRHRAGLLRGTGCWACDVLPVSQEERRRCAQLSGGIVDGHHVIPKQVLKRERPNGMGIVFGPVCCKSGHIGPRGEYICCDQPDIEPVDIIMPEEPIEPDAMVDHWPLDGRAHSILWDPRNGLPLRRWHHDQWEGSRLTVPRAMLPECVEGFARDVALTWWLDRSFGT